MLFVKPAFAQCPVCIVTVGGGMLIAKRLGVDDFIISLWISALNTVLSYWLAPKMKFPILKNPLIFSLLMFVFTLIYFLYTNELDWQSNLLLGVNKIFLGLVLGMVAIMFGNFLYSFAKAKNGGKTIFPYAKVAFPLGMVLIMTLFFRVIYKL